MQIVFRRPVLFAALILTALGCNGGGGDPDDPCESVVCDTPPAAVCDGDVVVTFALQGTCADGNCAYPEAERTPCDQVPAPACAGNQVIFLGAGTCSAGECDYPESGRLDCGEVPAPGCDEDQVVFFGAGTCLVGECDYPESGRQDCEEVPEPACDEDQVVFFGAGKCEAGECGYPESGRQDCEEVPEPACDGNQIVFFGAGTCEVGECGYPESGRQDCVDPPEPMCDGDDAVVFAGIGECREASCHYAEASRNSCESDSLYCDPGEGGCVDPCAGISCPPQDMWCEDGVAWMLVGHCDWRTAQCVYEETETDLSDCGFAYNYDFEHWAGGFPEGFVLHPTTGLDVIEDASTVNTGTRAARLETQTTESRQLRASIPFEYLVTGEVYTFHLWYRFQGRPAGGSSALIRPIIEVGDQDAEVSPEWVVRGPAITAAAGEWHEMTVTTPPVSADRFTLRPLVELRGESGETIVANVDDWAVTMPITRNLNSRRDLDSLLFLFNGNYWVASGIDNRGQIYPTGRSADVVEGWDQVLLTWVGTPSDSLVPAPWEKNGQVAGPGVDGALFAVLQNPTGHCEWRRYDAQSGAWNLVTAHSTCSNRVGDPAGLNYAVEGVLDLVAHLDGVDSPAEVPSWFHFAASHWETGAGGALITMTQAPASRDGNGNIDANETHRAHRATFLSGKVTYYFP